MLFVCGLANALNNLEINYSLNLIGDSAMKVRIKETSEPHSELALQKLYDCCFIKRNVTQLATCLKYFMDKYPAKDESINRVYYIFTNGFDEEYGLYNQWKKYIFNDKNCSFNFIISKSNSLDEEQSKTLSEFWNKFKMHWIKLQFNIQLIETTVNKIKELLIVF